MENSIKNNVLPEGQIPAHSLGAKNGVIEGSIMPLFKWGGGSQLALPPAPAPRWGTPAWFAAEIERTDHEQQAHFDALEQELKQLQNDHNYLIGLEAYGENKIALNTARDIKLGQLLIQMKRITKRLFIKWTDWAEEHIALKKRTRETIMRIAEYNFDQKWHRLGKSKLDRVCAALEPRFCHDDNVNLIMDYLVNRCGGENVFDDSDPRLENEIIGLYSACAMLKENESKFGNLKILVAAASAGFTPNTGSAKSFPTMTAEQIDDELMRHIETTSPNSTTVRHTKSISIKRSDEIFDQVEQYYALFISGETTDTFDKARAKKVVKMIEDMVNC